MLVKLTLEIKFSNKVEKLFKIESEQLKSNRF